MKGTLYLAKLIHHLSEEKEKKGKSKRYTSENRALGELERQKKVSRETDSSSRCFIIHKFLH